MLAYDVERVAFLAGKIRRLEGYIERRRKGQDQHNACKSAILVVQEEILFFLRSPLHVIISINGEPEFLVILKRFKDPHSISQPCLFNMQKWSDFYFSLLVSGSLLGLSMESSSRSWCIIPQDPCSRYKVEIGFQTARSIAPVSMHNCRS